MSQHPPKTSPQTSPQTIAQNAPQPIHHPANIPTEEMQAIISGKHSNVFSVLGLHQTPLGDWVVRVFAPNNVSEISVYNLQGTFISELICVHPQGFFIGKVDIPFHQPLILEGTTPDQLHRWRWVDPYCFFPVLGPVDDYLSASGEHMELYNKMGAHPQTHMGISGVNFSVWAPNVLRASVVGDFNDWDGRRHMMRKRSNGVWEIFVPDLALGTAYKFELIDKTGTKLPLKADPYGQFAEMRPANASRVTQTHHFVWHDQDYMHTRAQGDNRKKPMSIYEAHLGSWMRGENNCFLTYQELAQKLIPYVKQMGFTHIEVLPVSEHPLDASWGYQPTGLFAPTSRFGEPEGFAHFVDVAHQHGIGIILDWVPAHFPTDDHGLANFDGTALYEHEDKRKGFHPDWNTAIYNFGRTEVNSFLVNNALFWMDRYHLDGLRVDAVASMLYLDYSRKEGEWLPNKDGGRENLEAIDFLQRVNKEVYAKYPGVVTIAEESTAFPGVSQPVYAGGLGFGFKWNMGFMHDTLQYFQLEPIHRQYHHNDLTFGLLYAFSENFVLPLSHDEVVHGKGTLLSKMSGDDWQKFANLRAYYAFMWAYPGKKLLFMGQEFAQRAEWNENVGLDWHLTDTPMHQGVQQLVKDLNHAYLQIPALHQKDCDASGFDWLIVDDQSQSVFAWLRKGDDDHKAIAVIANLTPVPRNFYEMPLPFEGVWKEVINSDAALYGGSGLGNMGQIHAAHKDGRIIAQLTLPPLATLYFEYQGPSDH